MKPSPFLETLNQMLSGTYAGDRVTVRDIAQCSSGNSKEFLRLLIEQIRRDHPHDEHPSMERVSRDFESVAAMKVTDFRQMMRRYVEDYPQFQSKEGYGLPFRQYAPEPFAPRLGNPLSVRLSDDSLRMTIDGQEKTFALGPSQVSAVRNGFLPLSVLANYLLRKYDEHQFVLDGQLAPSREDQSAGLHL